VEALNELILNLKEDGKTVLITSHLLTQIEEVCDRIAVLDRGRLVVDCAVSELPLRDHRRMLDVSRLPERDLADLHAWLAARGHAARPVGPSRARLNGNYCPADCRMEQGGRGDET